MNERGVYGFPGNGHEGTGRLVCERPANFDAKKLIEWHNEDCETLRSGLQELEAQYGLLDTSTRPPGETEKRVAQFGVSLLHPQAINIIALQKTGLPIRFQQVPPPPKTHQNINPATGESSLKSCEAWLPKQLLNTFEVLNRDATRYPIGVMIHDIIGAKPRNVCLPDLCPNPSYASMLHSDRELTRAQHRELVDSGAMARFFLTQYCLNKLNRKLLTTAADIEEVVPVDEYIDSAHDLPVNLPLLYRYFEFRESGGFRAYTAEELLRLQTNVYQTILNDNPDLQMGRCF